LNSGNPEIYIGSRIEHTSERIVLERLLCIITKEKRPAIIMANINLNGRQIDLVLATDNLTLVIEAKGYSRPIRGSENGAWQVKLASGEWKDFSNPPNPYIQTLEAEHALKDAMSAFIGSDVAYPAAALVFVPAIPASSSVCSGDFKVSITGLEGLDAELQKSKSGWNLAQWRSFAQKHSFTRVLTPNAAFEPALREAENLLNKYLNGYSRWYGPGAEALVGFTCSADGQEITSEEVARRVSDGGVDLLLRGPSGCGKSLLSARIGMDWINSGGIPITIPSKDYRGNIKTVLECEVGLLDAPSAAKLLRAARLLNRPLLFILDGYNECQEPERAYLTRSISALLRRYEASILATSQTPIMRPDLLALGEIEVQLPNSEVKLAIAQLAAGGTITPEIEVLLDMVGSGLEASLVGAVGKAANIGSSRYALFDAFARKRLGSTASDGIRALSRIAGWLSERIAFTLSIRDLDRLLDAEHLPTSLFAQLNNAHLLIQRGDRVSFSHELFFNAFAAEAVIRRAVGHADPIVEALTSPRHAEHKEMIIGAIDDDVLLQQVLETITESKVVTFCLSGACGRYAQDWAEARFPTLIHRIGEEANRVRFMITDEGWSDISLDPDTLEKWSVLDLAFIFCLPELLAQGRYLCEMLDIASTMDRRIAEETSRLREGARERKIHLLNTLFPYIYVFQHPSSAGLTHVCANIQSIIFHRVRGENATAILREKIAEPGLSAGQLYLLLSLCSQAVDRDILTAPLVRKIIERYWHNAPYNLQLDLMQAAGRCWGANEVERSTLITTIEALPQTKNVLVSTVILEALQQLGALEDSAAEHKVDVHIQVEKFLSEPENAENYSAAHHVYYAQFDHPLSSAYWEVVSELSEAQRKRFLIMAAKGASDSYFFISCLLLDLVSFNDPKVGEIIGRWTVVPALDSCMPQEAIEVFVIAHLSLGRLGCVLPVQTSCGNPSADALTACGEILYWLNRIDMAVEIRRSNCREPLNVLLKNTGVALDAVRQCAYVCFDGTNRFPGAESVRLSIVDNFPERITEICRLALHSTDIQTGYFRHLSERDRVQVLNFALGVLGRHGNEADLSLLRQFSDDSNQGQSAIKAIKNLEQRVKFDGMV